MEMAEKKEIIEEKWKRIKRIMQGALIKKKIKKKIKEK